MDVGCCCAYMYVQHTYFEGGKTALWGEDSPPPPPLALFRKKKKTKQNKKKLHSMIMQIVCLFIVRVIVITCIAIKFSQTANYFMSKFQIYNVKLLKEIREQ